MTLKLFFLLLPMVNLISTTSFAQPQSEIFHFELKDSMGRILLNKHDICSAFLLSDRIIVTAAHCLYEDLFDNSPLKLPINWISKTNVSQIEFVHHSTQKQYSIKSLWFANSDPIPRWSNGRVMATSSENDWVILITNESIVAKNFFHVWRDTDQILNGKITEAFALGYPGNFGKERNLTEYHCKVGVTNISLRNVTQIQAPCKPIAYPGTSGGPLFIVKNGRYYALGVHSRTDTDAYIGRRNFIEKVDVLLKAPDLIGTCIQGYAASCQN